MIQPPEIAGIRFRTVPPPGADLLPRMDIAGFVGFAAMGPLDLPVAVEDPLRFRELFGPDLDLAWDDATGRFDRSRLGRAVEAFFANGGTRAWIVRVAGTGARPGRFALPELRGDATDAAAAFEARAPGRWSVALTAEAEFVRQRLRPMPQASFTPGGTALAVLPEPDGPVAGDLIEMVLPGEDLRGFLPVVAAETHGALTLGAPLWAEPDPLGGPVMIRVPAANGDAGFAAWSTGSPQAEPAFSLVRLSLDARIGDGPVLRLAGLGLGASHPRWFGRLPTDAVALGSRSDRFGRPPDPERAAFLAEATAPRFPLAAAADASTVWLPLGDDDRQAFERVEDGEDGFGEFGAAPFRDPDLAGAGLGALAGEANRKVYFLGQPATGLHALWPIDEMALLALPDAGHRQWIRTQPPVENLPGAPVLEPPEEVPGPAVYLRWSAVPDAESYHFEVAEEPGFGEPFAVEDVTGTEARYPLPSPCPRRVYFRVRAAVGGGIGPWSNSRGAWLPEQDARPCARPPIRHLTLDAAPFGSPQDAFVVTWVAEGGGPGPVEIEIETSSEPAFTEPETAFAGLAAEWIADQPLGVGLFVRARLAGPDGPHPWSNTVLLPPLPRSDYSLVTEREYSEGDLLAVHRAALRFCAARADLTVALSIAQHADPLEHLAILRPTPGAALSPIAAGVPPLSPGERPVLSFGAIYHPWVLGADGDEVRAEPPDGAMVGHAAQVAREASAWIAPANRPIADALGLTESYGIDDRQALEAALVNPLIRDPRGFLILSDWTLSDDSALRFMNVRRLMILLRRLALREGSALVFEPNDTRFRQFVRTRFERLMERMYLRGAFRGATADQAFRVVADDTLNPRTAVDAGRFLVELRVAPSRPLAFLRIQLFQADVGGLVARELP